MLRTRPPSEAETLRTVERLANDALPPGWSLRSRTEPNTQRGRADAEWIIRAPYGIQRRSSWRRSGRSSAGNWTASLPSCISRR